MGNMWGEGVNGVEGTEGHTYDQEMRRLIKIAKITQCKIMLRVRVMMLFGGVLSLSLHSIALASNIAECG